MSRHGSDPEPEVTISQEPSDAEVVARTMAGERAAFAILVRRYAAVARRTAAVLGAGADATTWCRRRS